MFVSFFFFSCFHSNQNNYGGNNNNRGGNQGQQQGPPLGADQFQPISTLNPYQNNWRIKVRVTRKDAVRHYHNAKGEGRLFGADLLDKEGNEISVTCFNETCDKFWETLVVGNTYFVSRGRVSVARKQFTHIKNDYSITLNERSEVTPIDDDSSIPGQTYNFTPIANIVDVDANSHVDVCAIVTKVNELTTIQSQKTQKSLRKRTLVLCDESNKSVEMTLWETDAVKFDEQKLQNYPIVAIKGARVSDFGGKSLNCRGNIVIAPFKEPKAVSLRSWWQRRGNQNNVQPLTKQIGGRYFFFFFVLPFGCFYCFIVFYFFQNCEINSW